MSKTYTFTLREREAVAIIKELKKARKPLTLSVIAHAMGFSTQRASILLKQLERRGFLRISERKVEVL